MSVVCAVNYVTLGWVGRKWHLVLLCSKAVARVFSLIFCTKFASRDAAALRRGGFVSGSRVLVW